MLQIQTTRQSESLALELPAVHKPVDTDEQETAPVSKQRYFIRGWTTGAGGALDVI